VCSISACAQSFVKALIAALYGCERSATLESMIEPQPPIFEPAGGPAQDPALALFGYQAGPGRSRLDLVLAPLF
jgi:hypothetical protein